MNKNNRKGGAEKLRLKRIAEFKSAGNDPKQKKLSFGLNYKYKYAKIVLKNTLKLHKK